MSKNQLFAHLTTNGRDMSWADLATKYGIASGEIARKSWLRERQDREKKGMPQIKALASTNDNVQTQNYISVLEDRVVRYEEDLKNSKAELTAVLDKEVRDIHDLIAKCKIDTNKWNVTKYTQAANGKTFNVKAWMELKKAGEADVLSEFLSTYQSSYEVLNKKDVLSFHDDEEANMLVLSLADPHIDKRAYQQGSTLRQNTQKYADCLSNLASRAVAAHNVEKILFVIGNDFFHTDNIQNMTTNGTPQDTNSMWHEAYEEGFDLMVSSISFLKQLGKSLQIVLVPGNHSNTKEFYLAHALKAFFAKDKSIIFDIKPIERKVVTYGEVFIGLAHGNCKRDKLPMSFSTEFYQDWGKCRYKEILLGDKHTDRQTSYAAKNEFSGVQVRELPSLSDTDKWHYENQYVENIQRGVALIYSPTEGKVAELYKNVS